MNQTFRTDLLMRLSFSCYLVVIGLFLSLATPLESDEPLVIELFPNGIADDADKIAEETVRMSPALERRQTETTESTRMITNVTRPTITVRRPANEFQTGTAVLIFPGGGYWNLYWEVEGEEVADWLTSHGITSILVKYRVPRRPGEAEREPAPRPLQDAQRAVSLVRSRAKEWGIHPDRIGVMGFSAGGHLAISTATNFEQRAYEPQDPIDEVSCRPDFAVAVYSGYLKAADKDELAVGLKVPKQTPPVFLVHGNDDIISPPKHSVVMYLALKRAGIPTELHIYSSSTHGFGIRPSDRPHAAWPATCVDWLKHLQLLESREKK